MTTECPPELRPSEEHKDEEENENSTGVSGSGVSFGDPTRRSEEDWGVVRDASSLLYVWGAWESWRDPEGNKFWFDTKTGNTTLEDPIAMSTDDEEYMDKDTAVSYTHLTLPTTPYV